MIFKGYFYLLLISRILYFLEVRSRYFSARFCKVLPNSSFCANNKIDIMRWRGVFHVFNAMLSGNGKTNLIHIQTYAFNLRRTNHIVCQVLCHCAQFAVKSQRAQPAMICPNGQVPFIISESLITPQQLPARRLDDAEYQLLTELV